MTAALASARIEVRRLTRSGLLLGLVAVFAFFGLLGPALALYMPEILRSATGSDQLTILAAAATPESGIALFSQSAMQLGLILAVAVAITGLSWDARPGSSIFYRVRVKNLGALTIPRLATGWIAVTASYSLGLILAVTLTTVTIGEVGSTVAAEVWVASVVYLIMAMSIGYLIMTAFRRTAPAIAVATILMLVLPLLSQVELLAPWVPTTLLAAPALGFDGLVFPALSAIVVSAVCIAVASLISGRQSLRRDG